MSKHSNKRGRPSLGLSPPASKRANKASSFASPVASSSTAFARRPNRIGSSSSTSQDDADLPGPATQRASLSAYDQAAILVPRTIRNIWSFFQANPVPKPALERASQSSRKKRRTSREQEQQQHEQPEMSASERSTRPPSPLRPPTPRRASSLAMPPPPPPSDWRASLAQNYAASIPLPPSPPRAREWLPSAGASSSSSSSSSTSRMRNGLQPSPQARSQAALHTPLRATSARISKPTPGSATSRSKAGSPVRGFSLRAGGSDGKTAKERMRNIRAKGFLLEQAQLRFKQKQEQERKRTGHVIRADSGVDKVSFADLAQTLAQFDSDRERTADGKSSLLRDIQAAGKPAQGRPEDWVAQLTLTETKAKSARRPPKAVHLPSYEKLLSEDEARDKKIAERIAALHVEKLPDDLTPEQNQEVQRLLADTSRVNRCQNAEVKRADLVLLKPRTWLNDEVMNFYCAMIVDACNARLKLADAWGEKQGLNLLKARRQWVGPQGELAMDVHAFSTFFFSKLEDPNAGYVKGRLNRWTKKVDIFKKDLVLVPINQGNAHWTCAVINFRFKRIEAYDSMGRPGGARFVFQALRSYLQLESQDKKKVDFDFDGWEDYSDHEITPQQLNGYDCGVFSCHFLEAVSIGAGCGNWSFGQENMPYLRKRMMLEIGRAKLLNHPDSKP